MSTETTPATAETPSASSQADALIRRHTVYSMAAGLVPLPLVDIAAVTGVQVKMLGEVCEAYGQDFDAERTRSVIASLLATVSGISLGRGVVASLVKAIPVVGTIGGMAAVPVMAGATTYALGRVFAAHFESGGTLLTFDAAKMKDEFKRQIKVGEGVADSLKSEVAAAKK